MRARNVVLLDGIIEDQHASARFGVRTSAGVMLAGLNTRLHRSSRAIRRGDRVRVLFDTDNPVMAVIVDHEPGGAEKTAPPEGNLVDR